MKTFKGFDLDKNGCIVGAYPSFTVHSELREVIETITEKENEYVLRLFTSMNIDPDVLVKQKAEIEKLNIENEQLKAQIEKMKCCGNCKWLEHENEYVYCKHTYCAKNLHSEWELAE